MQNQLRTKTLPDLTYGDWADWESAYQSAFKRNFFLGPHWGRLISAIYHFDPRILVFSFGTRQVVLPCFITRRIRGVFQGLRSMPTTHYGGLLADAPIESSIARSIAQRLSQEWLIHTVIVSSAPGREIAGWSEYQAHAYSTHVLDISAGYLSVWERSFPSSQRRCVRKAQRAGLEVRTDKSAEAVASFYELYRMSCTRWGLTTPEPKQFFETLINDAGDAVQLWLASQNNKDVAGIVIANDGKDHAYYLSGASDPRAWECRPNNLLMTSAIEAACSAGLSDFDFLPSGRLSGVERFKESFGAVPIVVPEYWLKGRLPSIKHRRTHAAQSVNA
jgi:CelD/BcsL family acetyltransferase involved in cellulose biosynthesis